MTDTTAEKSKRRSRGDGGLYWDEQRQRWIASATVGYTPAGKRIVRKGSGRTKTEAKSKLKEILRDHEDGLVIEPQKYTVAQAVNDWLKYGLNGRDPNTVKTREIFARTHVIPALGARPLHRLTATDVDEWLSEKAKTLSTRTLREIRSILSRSVARAQARDKVRRNVVLLCEVPTGQPGRPSKSLTFVQAEALLRAAEGTRLFAYIVVSLLTGARTEELRALTWADVDLAGNPAATTPVPAHIRVWRSVRAGGDTKTKKSRRSLAIPRRCTDALRTHRDAMQAQWKAAGLTWSPQALVFATSNGTALDPSHVRRDFRRVVAAAGLEAKDWTPRELRHSFVSLLSDDGMPLEQISRLVGHSGTSVTEAVYRKQIRPVIEGGATAMDRIFPADREAHGTIVPQLVPQSKSPDQ